MGKKRKKQSSCTVHAHRWQDSGPNNFLSAVKGTAAQTDKTETSLKPPQCYISGCWYSHAIQPPSPGCYQVILVAHNLQKCIYKYIIIVLFP